MMNRKFEEGDWAQVYCTAKNIPTHGWSNLRLDVVHNGLGLEHKMLRPPAGAKLLDLCGTRLMHPSATRSIRVPSTDADPNDAMRDVLMQYSEWLQDRQQTVKAAYPATIPDMRTGWLLWQPGLREFLYFEEETLPPDPNDYTAEWRESGGGSRKPSKNLWVYEKDTGQKRYSITTQAGAKVQPYFDVPPPNDPNVYLFNVQGEEYTPGFIRVWVLTSTAHELRRLIGDPTPESMAIVIENAANEPNEAKNEAPRHREEATPLILTTASYELLATSFPGVSDEHMVQLLVERLSNAQ